MTYTETCQQEGHTFCSPYYAPEHYGLSIVGVVEQDIAYEFDMFVIWTDGEKYYWAEDSGCSCPIPFEDAELIAGTAKKLSGKFFTRFGEIVTEQQVS